MIFLSLYREEKYLQKTAVLEQKGKIQRSPWLIYLLQSTQNAIAQKDLYLHYGLNSKRRKFFHFFVFVLLFLGIFFCIKEHAPPFVLFIGELVAFGILSTGLASTSVAKEIEQDHFDLIRSTLITPTQFLQGKFQAVFLSLSVPLLLCGFFNYMMVFATKYNDNLYKENVLEAFFLISVSNLYMLIILAVTVMISITCSVFCKNSTSATLVAYFFNVAFYGGILFLVVMVLLLLSVRGGADMEYLMIFCPLAILVIFYENRGVDSFGLILILHMLYLYLLYFIASQSASEYVHSKKWVTS